ncbi:hypothetical protein CEP54_005008 [Fusarium duplospermum]|uniref:Uncharacterized protein n=1 Tax=Fusarium duplospermum TaxID=1325734 RepID=A0A428QEV6_9HYPO|nr:hypothetical protein CEP54_005008 [Fusarium duplospermum]
MQGPIQTKELTHPAPFSLDNLASLSQPRLACVLAPHIAITPEVTALEPGCHILWAAIEVSGRLWPASESMIEPGPCRKRSGCSKSFAGCGQQGDPFEFGRIYDLKVQVLPTEKSSIVRVLRNQCFPISLNAGSSALLLTQMQVDVKLGTRNGKQGNPRPQSDDLIEDLEAELGNSHVESEASSVKLWQRRIGLHIDPERRAAAFTGRK